MRPLPILLLNATSLNTKPQLKFKTKPSQINSKQEAERIINHFNTNMYSFSKIENFMEKKLIKDKTKPIKFGHRHSKKVGTMRINNKRRERSCIPIPKQKIKV